MSPTRWGRCACPARPPVRSRRSRWLPRARPSGRAAAPRWIGASCRHARVHARNPDHLRSPYEARLDAVRRSRTPPTVRTACARADSVAARRAVTVRATISSEIRGRARSRPRGRPWRRLRAFPDDRRRFVLNHDLRSPPWSRRLPINPSTPMPLMTTARARASSTSATDRNSGSAAGRQPCSRGSPLIPARRDDRCAHHHVELPGATQTCLRERARPPSLADAERRVAVETLCVEP